MLKKCMENENDKNQESLDNQDIQIKEIQDNQKPKSGRTFLVVSMLIISIFISATTGAIFGFLASSSGSTFFGKIESSQWGKIFSENQPVSPVQVKQNIIQEDSAVIDVVKKTSPSVVSIVISKDVSTLQNQGGASDFFDPFNFFGQGGGSANGNKGGSGSGTTGGTQKQDIGGGTGFFITGDGMVVTNRHVVDDSTASYTVVTSDGQKYPAKVLAVDPIQDVAVIKVEGNNFPTLELGNSDSVQIGQTVVAIGNSLGQFSNTVSRGIISGLQRNVTAGGETGQTEKLTNIIQTDAAINPGNSGGPLLDIEGSVIGINVAIASGAQNIGFAIPANQVAKIIDQVKTTGKISTPFLGVRYIPVDDALQKQNNLPYNYGVLVARGNAITDLAVVPGSPADKAGIVENDILLEVDGIKIEDASGKTLTELIAQHKTGDNVDVKIWHKGKLSDVTVTLEERKQ